MNVTFERAQRKRRMRRTVPDISVVVIVVRGEEVTAVPGSIQLVLSNFNPPRSTQLHAASPFPPQLECCLSVRDGNDIGPFVSRT